MKQRIMSRVEIARVMLNRRNSHEKICFDDDEAHRREMQAGIDVMFYMIADDKTVRIYHDTAMGGTVVEIAE